MRTANTWGPQHNLGAEREGADQFQFLLLQLLDVGQCSDQILATEGTEPRFEFA